MNIYSIYRVTNNINRKVYIGFTSTTLSGRRADHKFNALRQKEINKFYNAIRKYGWDNFSWDIIYQAMEPVSMNDSHTLTVMENHFIDEYDSIKNGYNTLPGGGKFPVMRGSDHPLYGIGHSDETKKLLRLNHHDVSGANNPKAKRITIVTPNGETYQSFGNLDQVCKQIEIPSHVISNMLHLGKSELIRGKRKGLKAFYS
jgi:hypothetical protein